MSGEERRSPLMSARTGLGGVGRRAREEWSAGGVVLRRVRGTIHALLIKDPYGKWGLPKGHLESGEDDSAASLREVEEETGLNRLELGPRLQTIDWYFRLRGRLVHKHCTFFLMGSRAGEVVPEEEEGITECRWVPLLEAMDKVVYENARDVIREAVRIVAREESSLSL